ncbi:MAG: tetratricopeptide repeat protein [Polyangiaceae bacterium]
MTVARTTTLQWLKSKYPLVLVALIGISYGSVFRAQFVWDDDDNILESPNLHDLAGLARIWTDPKASQQYYPLTHTSFWIQAQTTGLAPLPFHALNVALHAAGAVLLLFVLRRLAVAGAEFAVTLFALHPLNVESVAWVTERKNVLSGALVFAACLFYVMYDEAAFSPLADDDPRASRARRRNWCLAFALFVLALAAKTAVAVVPAALLVVLVGLRGRRIAPVAAALAPFFVVGVAAGLVTAVLERNHVNATGAEFSWSVAERVLIAGRAFFFYLHKLLVPENLIFFYPKWRIDAHAPLAWLFPIGVVALLGALFALRRRLGVAPFLALLAYGLLIFPALGFFNVYFMRFSYVQNHFQYLAGVPVLALIAATGARVLERTSAQLRLAVAAAITLLCGWLTFLESAQFRDYETLFLTTLEQNPDAWVAANNLGLYYQKRHALDAAIVQYRNALRVRPEDPQIFTNLGAALADSGHLPEALTALREAARLRPQHPESQFNLASALEQARDPAAAVAAYREALRLRPGYTRVKRQLAWLLATTEDPQVRDGKAATALARSACAETVRAVARCQDTLAAAEAASGDFVNAATRAKRAAQLARQEGEEKAAQRYDARARLYEAGQSYVESAQAPAVATPNP